MSDGAVIVYSVGIVAASVCAPSELTSDEVVAKVNVLEPTGIDSPWRMAADRNFHTGQPNPCPCDRGEGRTHYLLEC